VRRSVRVPTSWDACVLPASDRNASVEWAPSLVRWLGLSMTPRMAALVRDAPPGACKN
jgi:hypothetical protein